MKISCFIFQEAGAGYFWIPKTTFFVFSRLKMSVLDLLHVISETVSNEQSNSASFKVH